MDLSFTPEEKSFRQEVRAFVRANLPEEIRHKVQNGSLLTRDELMRWHRILAEHGWGAPTWPKEHGGAGWDPVRDFIFEEECASWGAPRLLPFGLRMVGPVIMTFGNAAQHRRFLPRIASAQDFWCQGYSEPGSGSDLASLKTKAERRGDSYVVNGQKTWITLAHYADWIFCLVRTDPAARAQSGISFLLIDMKTKGITVRPIITMDGGHEVNEVWFEDVKVPAENLVGEENKGWTYAKFLLGHERTNIAGVGPSKSELQRLKQIAQDQGQRDPAGDRRADDAGDGSSGAVVRARFRGAGRARGAGIRRAAHRHVLQLPQDLDLQRLERDPEEHHLAVAAPLAALAEGELAATQLLRVSVNTETR